ncbi:MAG: type II/IV secretion system ATPase subunit [Candidatus Methanomethyliaceae archaeon]|nr:type II/IV secretion system ATPase subunit [Candidatus Methanomethyliaceae archaeon]MDW7971305.1 type II/IV secretion system ATPase subunit [Nitrososphaerota archaeon]
MKFLKFIRLKRSFREIDLPSVKIHILRGSLNGKILAEYKVGLSNVSIVNDSYVINDPAISEEEVKELERKASQLLYLLPLEAIKDEKIFEKYVGINNEVLLYFLKRELLGYGAYDILMNDENIEDIVSWPGQTICKHREFGTLKVNIELSEKDFERHIEKLVHMAGKSISLFHPILSARLPTNDRLTVTYAREVSDKPSFAIRKFPRKPWSITSIMMMGTLTPEMAAYLMLLIKYKKAILICGPIGSGKTSLINALCSLIPAESIVVTVEDTPELRLARRNWISFITRESMNVEERGEITMFDLVKHALRQPADYIIVGEVRGEEGRIWAQAISTGHGGITSLHADTPEGALERLRADPIRVSEGALRFLSTIVIIKSITIEKGLGIRINGRRVLGIYDLSINGAIPIFKYEPTTDSFIQVNNPIQSRAINEIMEIIPRFKLEEEYRLYTSFLRRLKETLPLNPQLGSHIVVTELVQELYRNSLGGPFIEKLSNYTN